MPTNPSVLFSDVIAFMSNCPLTSAERVSSDRFHGSPLLSDFTSLFLFRDFCRGQQSALSRTTGSRGDPSRDRHLCSAPDTGPWNAGLPRCRVEEPSTSGTERPDPTPRPEAGLLRPRAEGLRHRCYLPVGLP